MILVETCVPFDYVCALIDCGIFQKSLIKSVELTRVKFELWEI